MAIETFLSSMGQDLNSLCEHIVHIWLDLRQDANSQVVLSELSAQELLFSLLHADVIDNPIHPKSPYITPEDRQTFERVVKDLAAQLIDHLESVLKHLQVSDRQLSLAKADGWLGLSLVMEIPVEGGV